MVQKAAAAGRESTRNGEMQTVWQAVEKAWTGVLRPNVLQEGNGADSGNKDLPMVRERIYDTETMGETILQPSMCGVRPKQITRSTQRQPPNHGGRIRNMEREVDPSGPSKQFKETRETGSSCMRRHQYVQWAGWIHRYHSVYTAI